MIDFQKEKEAVEAKFKNVKLVSIDNRIATCVCSKHGEFKKNKNDLMKSAWGCPKCSFEHMHDYLKISPEEFIKEAQKIQANKYNYSLVDQPMKKSDTVSIVCPKHGEFKQTASSHLEGHGCPKCAYKNKKITTTDEIIKKCREKYGDKYDYSLVDWKDGNKITIICPKHGAFETNYYDFLRGHECPKCSLEKARDREERKWKDSMEKLNNNEVVFPEGFKYINSYTKVKVIYKGKEYERDPHTFLKKKLLTEKDKEDIKIKRGINKSIERWKNLEDELKSIYGDSLSFKKEQIDFIKSGKSSPEYILDIKCKKHGWTKQSFFELRCGYGCPACMYKKASAAEEEIYEYIKTLYSGNIIKNDRIVLSGRELDLYIPEKDIAIEYDGLYWHNNINNYFKYDLCRNKSIRLIQITEYEWKYEKEKIKNFLKSLFCGSFVKIGARKCCVKEISTKEYREFCETNHLQGYAASSIRLGLFFNNELIEVEGFSKARFGKYEWEFIRECSKNNCLVEGGKSKLLAYFERKYNPKNIVSYCEKNKFSGKSYLSCGFKLDHESYPGYSYYKNKQKYSRMSFQKKMLKDKLCDYDSSLTETENMLRNGYFKIFDYGNFVYVKSYST